MSVFRPPGDISNLDPSTVRVGPLTVVPAVPQSARPDAVRALKAGVVGPYEILADFDRNMIDLVAKLRAANGDWSRIPAMVVDQLIALSAVEQMHFSAAGRQRPDKAIEAAAQTFRDIAIFDCGADSI